MRHLLVLTVLLMAGCELADTSTTEQEQGQQTTPTTQTTSTTQPSSEQTATDAADEAEWRAIKWQGNGAASPDAVKVMNLTSASVSSSGNTVSFTWDQFPWNGSALGHFFVWDGTAWAGGKFEWILQGGQGTKLMESVHAHYNGLSVPPSGTPVAFAWTSADGTERSNLAKTVWP